MRRIARSRSWSGVEGCLTVEVQQVDGVWFDMDAEDVPECLSKAIQREFAEMLANPPEDLTFQVELDFTASGSWEDDSWDCPGGSNEDRELIAVTISPSLPGEGQGYDRQQAVKLETEIEIARPNLRPITQMHPTAEAFTIFAEYEEQVDAVKLEYDTEDDER